MHEANVTNVIWVIDKAALYCKSEMMDDRK